MCDHHSSGSSAAPTVRPGLPTTPLTRRAALGSAGAGLLMAGLLSPSTGAVAAAGSRPAVGALRRSRVAGAGTTLVHADLHNHTLLSDGDGDPALAFDSLRSAGLDVAALTDHATYSDSVLGEILAGMLPAEYRQAAGLTPEGWARTKQYADAADADGAFTAIRGFEWSEPLLGHVNVWFTEHYVDVLQAGVMAPLLEWLRREPGLVLDGGADGIAGFNHPGREPGRFEEFRFDPRVRDRMVSLEMFNRRDDYLFEGWADGRSSPLCACLNAGWRTGLSGVTDEHGIDWGHPEGKGRTGLWVDEHSRAGVKAAMLARRFFATRTSGLRVDALALTPDLRPARMGSVLPMRRGTATFVLDVDRGASWRGRRLDVQVLRPGPEVPEVVAVEPFEVGTVHRLRVPVDVADGDWVLLRVADPDQPNATPGPAGQPGNDLGIAYTSPWWLDPDAA
ncbi:CehA/McbA family metallohydrolase [Nocardioides sp. GCM10027113]|uniref:CehA/McbA family metallohydrolase n=1 Tax=unclassified Nocardioides TaxID=2615069 RepID=UPI0036177455